MKKLNTTKKRFTESRYFQKKYGTLKYVSESGDIYKTSKGKLIRFVKEGVESGQYREQAEQLKKLLDETSNAVSVRVSCGGLCPYMAFVTLDALDKADWPNGISDNSYFLKFEVDFRSGKVEILNAGTIPFNKDDDKGYMYGFGLKELMLKTGRKPFRKCGFKSIDDLVNKMNSFYDSFVAALEEYKGEYPYRGN